MPKDLEIKPKVLPGILDRLNESIMYRERRHATAGPDKRGNRRLPHKSKAFGIALLSPILPVSLISLGLIDFLGSFTWYGVYILFIFALGIPVFFLTQIIFLYKEVSSRKYIITDEGVEIINNFIDRGRTSVSYQDMANVRLERPLIQRIFGTGNVLIETAGSSGPEARLEYIENPETVQEELADMAVETDYNQPS